MISPSTTQALVFVLSALLFSLAKEAWEVTKKPSCNLFLKHTLCQNKDEKYHLEEKAFFPGCPQQLVCIFILGPSVVSVPPTAKGFLGKEREPMWACFHHARHHADAPPIFSSNPTASCFLNGAFLTIIPREQSLMEVGLLVPCVKAGGKWSWSECRAQAHSKGT